ncbi:GNAT family N-acetyltransferase [Marivivens sp. JLT3646]|uniref:GNAT family N-acetyltransferase n=1 Tax=Marivivens sp. JLT3646 TaxID=1920883 RepID=UPI0007FF0403|nr:N-acetyltransferase [Marivivens sp. JLT3646]APO86600.1 GNAT family N-acetyltransferase [Marivivens sp. JLT3646]OBR38386.1 acetyltransferase [Donghicola sp. JL3646]
MEFTTEYSNKADAIISMFFHTFAVSEGDEAGTLIKALVTDMLTSLASDDIHVFSAIENGEVLASIIFTRMTYADDTRTVFILAPVAVATAQQGKGLGQRLINHALQTLLDGGVDVVLTYGDINFYSKVGFTHITEADAQPPLPLQYPEGWLGQTLEKGPFLPLKGPSKCVGPLDDPNHW